MANERGIHFNDEYARLNDDGTIDAFELHTPGAISSSEFDPSMLQEQTPDWLLEPDVIDIFNGRSDSSSVAGDNNQSYSFNESFDEV